VPNRPSGSKPAHVVCATGGGYLGTENPNHKKFKKIVTARGSNPGGGEIFQCPFRPALWSTQTSFAMGTVSLPEVKRPERGAYNPPPSSAEVANRSELCLRLICVYAEACNEV
jgi:hypothetical protein